VAGVTPTLTATGVISATDIDLAGLPLASGGSNVAVTSPAAVSAIASTTAVATECVISAAPAASSSCTVVTTTVMMAASSTLVQMTSAPAATTAAAGGAGESRSFPKPGIPNCAILGVNIQSFTGSLGGLPPPVISGTGARPFTVLGDTFVNSPAALQRSCSVQHNKCSDAANSGTLAGGQAQCETQEDECNEFDGVSSGNKLRARAALSFGSCGAPTIVFEAGLDGRNTEAFIAVDQKDYNHGSALNIGVIAGFICQRLGSPCNAPADVQASCTSASAAAVATSQNQAAADVFNSILGVGGGGAGAGVTTTAAAVATTAPASSMVMTFTSCA
jgi:hypothetical protein